MPSFKPKELWPAAPHTLAKIEIVRQYLVRWFQILGRGHASRRLLYIDGFAGPGEYTNSKDSSPIAALSAAKDLMYASSDFRDMEVVFLFVEKEPWCAEHLRSLVKQKKWPLNIKWDIIQGTFDAQVGRILQQIRLQGQQLAPTFAFIDPFGATGLPFDIIKEILGYRSCEVLLNLDSDGVGRLFKAKGQEWNRDHLDAMFGDQSWQVALNPHASMAELTRQVLTLYKQKLRSIPNVHYVFPFSMGDRHGRLSYHLVFASQHRLGLEKMKEAMESVDASGSFSFSDAGAGEVMLPFDFKHPESWARKMQSVLAGKSRQYSDFDDYALNETPFKNPKKMLEWLKKQASVEVEWHGLPAKHGFPEEKIKTIMLKRETDQLI